MVIAAERDWSEDDLARLLDLMNHGETIFGGSPEKDLMHRICEQTQRYVGELNQGYHTPDELRALMEKIMGRSIDPSFSMYTPFYTEFGRNTHLGRSVFINSCCCFQDQGGIYIGDGTYIGQAVVLATLNHDLDPAKRDDLHPAPIHLGSHVWIGAHASVMPGVSVGNGAVIGAGAVVTKDVPERVVVAGVPARVIREIK